LAFLGGLALYVTSLIQGGVPVLDRLFPRRHSILILRALAVVVGAGRPVAPALYSLGEWYPTPWVRLKLRKAAEDAHLGVDWVEALLFNGLINEVDAGVLAASSRVGNLAWALRELAATAERRRSYRLQALTHVLFAAAIVAMGSVVFFIALAYFAPLVTLITRLAR
jgi:protein transport protein HofC